MSQSSNRSGLVGGLTQAGLVLIGGLLGVFLWRGLIQAGIPLPSRLPPGRSLLFNADAGQLVSSRLGTSLTPLLVALVLGLLVGLAMAAVRTALTLASEDSGHVAGGIGWLAGMLWTAPAPVALTVLLVLLAIRSPGNLAQLRGLLATLAMAGVAAALVAVSTGERWRRHRWAAGTVAGVGAACRAAAAAAGMLLVVEVLLGSPGLGSVAVQAISQHDTSVVVAAVTPLLVIALIGQLLGSLAVTAADYLDDPPATEGPRSSLGTLFTVVAVGTLAIPVIVLLASAFASTPSTGNLGQALMGPSASHLLGTDPLGRDVLAELLTGFRLAWLTAVAGVLLATVVGGVWGVLAALLYRLPEVGRPLAELLVSPGRLLSVAPLLIAGAILAGADRLPAILVLAIALTPRIAAAVLELAERSLESVAALQIGTGLVLCCVGVALPVLVGLQVLGLATPPPSPSLGGVIVQNQSSLFLTGTAAVPAVVVILTSAPFLLAGWSLLRHPWAADALAMIET